MTRIHNAAQLFTLLRACSRSFQRPCQTGIPRGSADVESVHPRVILPAAILRGVGLQVASIDGETCCGRGASGKLGELVEPTKDLWGLPKPCRETHVKLGNLN